MTSTQSIYRKQQSFEAFFRNGHENKIVGQKARALQVLSPIESSSDTSHPSNWVDILENVKGELKRGASESDGQMFDVNSLIADEMAQMSDEELPKYLYHRYRYDVFPQIYQLDDYPPYLQIEPTSICNYRCVFCYQIDNDFSKKKSAYMGSMDIGLFQNVIDQIEGNVEFLSLASRGEPLLNKLLPQMLEYTTGKFLNLKLNTNASRLTEKLSHYLLNGSIRTLVFSVDAASDELYSRLRVNGRLSRVLKNIERFQKIRATQYSDARIITRVSGVKVNDEQNMNSMIDVWGNLVDQISFVAYNPWENIYTAPENNIGAPCSDLWRRLFVWFDGTVNPCDSDYRSTLAIGNFKDKTVKQFWKSDVYQSLRQAHLSGNRQAHQPCARCVVV